MAIDELMGRVLAELGLSAEEGETVPVDVIHRLVGTGDTQAPMPIAEVAELLNLSPHTLRYYERTGLIAVDRNEVGHRLYDAEAVRRLVFITRMRLSGMPMRDLQHYIELVDQGAHTEPERLKLLVEHREAIRGQILELQLSLVATEYKIATYGGRTGDEGVGP